MKTFNYVLGAEKEIEKGEIYYFGQIWDGNYDAEMLLEDGCICVDEETATIVDFTVIKRDCEDILKTIVKVTDIY